MYPFQEGTLVHYKYTALVPQVERHLIGYITRFFICRNRASLGKGKIQYALHTSQKRESIFTQPLRGMLIIITGTKQYLTLIMLRGVVLFYNDLFNLRTGTLMLRYVYPYTICAFKEKVKIEGNVVLQDCDHVTYTLNLFFLCFVCDVKL